MRYSELFSRSLRELNNSTRALEVQLLVERAFNLTRQRFWIDKDTEITDKKALKTFHRFFRRLLNHEPAAYILREKEFYGERFYVDKGVLIPRPETELLVETCIGKIEAIPSDTVDPLHVVDIGAGSGIIAIMLAKRTRARLTAVELSSSARRVLRRNIRLHGVEDRVWIGRQLADLFPGDRFDLIVSNPPYIPLAEWRQLDPTVKKHEPKMALVSGKDGLQMIRYLAAQAPRYLKPGGWLLMEIGYNQKKAVREILENEGFTAFEFIDDYSRIPRVVTVQKI